MPPSKTSVPKTTVGLWCALLCVCCGVCDPCFNGLLLLHVSNHCLGGTQVSLLSSFSNLPHTTTASSPSCFQSLFNRLFLQTISKGWDESAKHKEVAITASSISKTGGADDYSAALIPHMVRPQGTCAVCTV